MNFDKELFLDPFDKKIRKYWLGVSLAGFLFVYIPLCLMSIKAQLGWLTIPVTIIPNFYLLLLYFFAYRKPGTKFLTLNVFFCFYGILLALFHHFDLSLEEVNSIKGLGALFLGSPYFFWYLLSFQLIRVNYKLQT